MRATGSAPTPFNEACREMADVSHTTDATSPHTKGHRTPTLPRHNETWDFDKIREELLAGPRMTVLMPSFEKIAAGIAQRPRQNIVASPLFLEQHRELEEYHRVFQSNLGAFLRHGCASIPFLLEELVRVGVAIHRLSREWPSEHLSYYETSSADGTVARTLAEFSHGNVKTLTDSPNSANEIEFSRLCTHAHSHFYNGSFADITPSFVKDRYPMFRDGFDIIWENTTFQMYGNYRDQQIAYVKRLLKKDGLMIFLEKMNHPCPNEYARRERIKDDLFKSRYFTAEEIARKRVDIIDIMERGQVTLDSFTKSAMEQFKHVHVLWNSLNFYHVVATDSADTLAAFISKLEAPFIPSEFDCEALSCNPCESVARD